MRRYFAGLAAALVVAFVALPRLLPTPRVSFRPAFAEWWAVGERELTPALSDYVGYWFRYHLVKGVIAAALLVVLVLLAARVRRSVPAVAAVSALGLAALVALMANVQGAVAPFASLFPLLSADDLRGPAAALRAGDRTPALVAMIDDYTLYHAAMIGIAGTVAVAFFVVSALVFRRWPLRLPAALLGVAALVVVVANTTTTLDPEPGLLAFFQGGW